MKMMLVLSLIGACVSLPHVDPDTRTSTEAAATAVRVSSQCPWSLGDDGTRLGTGVIISERHVLTAAHIVECPDIPTVRVGLSNGRVLRVLVTKEDRVADVARLEILSADRFGLDIEPPTLGYPRIGADACAALAWPFDGHACGPYLGEDLVGIPLEKGTSGAAVYSQQGHMIGIVIRGDGKTYTRLAPISGDWLSGT